MSNARTPRQAYVYVWLDSDGQARYVGKGRDDRAWTCHGFHGDPTLDRFRVVVLRDNLDDDDALRLEQDVIAAYRLLNQPLSNVHHNPSERPKIVKPKPKKSRKMSKKVEPEFVIVGGIRLPPKPFMTGWGV